jgi:hypothetical protein
MLGAARRTSVAAIGPSINRVVRESSFGRAGAAGGRASSGTAKSASSNTAAGFAGPNDMISLPFQTAD